MARKMNNYRIPVAAVIGSEASRDGLDTEFIRDCRNYVRMRYYSGTTSLISVMAEPVDMDSSLLDTDNLRRVNYKSEIDKDYMQNLTDLQPDILILDFYSDARYGVCSVRDTYTVNRIGYLRDQGFLSKEDCGEVYNYRNHEDTFMQMWTDAADCFINYCREKLPLTRLVINGIKGNNVIRDSRGHEYIEQKINVSRINAMWERMDRYAADTYRIPLITYDREYKLDPDYPGGLGVSLVHYSKDYYMDYLMKLMDYIF